jgi:hypothetical protein
MQWERIVAKLVKAKLPVLSGRDNYTLTIYGGNTGKGTVTSIISEGRILVTPQKVITGKGQITSF